ncbi:MAG: hypothetical protein LBD32_01590, partial [Cytophagales bacterium]|nr:hypothetical protein [Cytophagales bacterium]
MKVKHSFYLPLFLLACGRSGEITKTNDIEGGFIEELGALFREQGQAMTPELLLLVSTYATSFVLENYINIIKRLLVAAWVNEAEVGYHLLDAWLETKCIDMHGAQIILLNLQKTRPTSFWFLSEYVKVRGERGEGVSQGIRNLFGLGEKKVPVILQPVGKPAMAPAEIVPSDPEVKDFGQWIRVVIQKGKLSKGDLVIAKGLVNGLPNGVQGFNEALVAIAGKCTCDLPAKEM